MNPTRERNSLIVNNILLAVIGLTLLVLYRIGQHASGVNDIAWFLKLAFLQSGLYLIAAWLIVRNRGARGTVLLVLVLGCLFRLSILFAPPYLSDDIYRYVWDGRVQAAGINPYRYVPADENLQSLRDEKIYPKINRRDYAHTIYPPVAEAVFLLTTRVSESITWMKATMIGFEALAVWAIIQLLTFCGLPRQRILIYAWHPLLIWEFAGSGHVDPIAIAFIALALLARRKNAEIATGVALGGVALAKIFPIVVLPALLKRWNLKIPLAAAITILLGYIPYLSVGPRGALVFLLGHAPERGIESGEQFFLLSAINRLPWGLHVPTAAFAVLAVLIMGGLAVWMVRTQKSGEQNYIGNALVLAATFTVLVTPHFPWYYAWLVPFLCFVPSVPVFYLSVSSFLLYLTWLYWSDEQVFRIKAVIFVPFFLLAGVALWFRWKGLNRREAETKLSTL